MKLFNIFSKLLKDCKQSTNFWLISSIYVFIGLIPTYYLGEIRNEDDVLAKMAINQYVIFNIVALIGGYFYGLYIGRLTRILRKKFIEQGYHKYDSMTHTSKGEESSDSFRRKLSRAAWAVTSVADWGIPTLISLVKSVLGAIYIFYKESLIALLFFIVFGNLFVYIFVTRWLQYKFTQERKKIVEVRDTEDSMIQSELPRMEIGDINPNELINRENKIIDSRINFENGWQNISFVTKLSNQLPMIYFIINQTNTVGFFFLFSKVFGMISGSISSIMSFLNQYSNLAMDFDKYEEMWKNKDFIIVKPQKIDIPEKVVIKNIRVKREKFKVVGKGFEINQGDKILIKGSSGGGKSTFVTGLTGKLKGIELDKNKPENYYHQIIECHQNIKEKMLTKAITIRQLFDGEKDNKLIEKCLELACALDWAKNLQPNKEKKKMKYITVTTLIKNFISKNINRFFKNKSKEKKDDSVNKNDKIIEIGDLTHVFDRKIYERHSGGQKTRLALATRIYQLVKKKGRWLILDEPEQGSDPEIAYNLVKNLINEFPKITFIVISHLEKIYEKEKWTKFFKVDNGMIKKIN